jgi:hypothetical protein
LERQTQAGNLGLRWRLSVQAFLPPQLLVKRWNWIRPPFAELPVGLSWVPLVQPRRPPA